MSARDGTRIYQLIDADAHVNEPPDLWTSRVPVAFRDRAPRMERFDEGDGWVLEGVEGPVNFGLNAAAGLDLRVAKPWVRWEDIRPGGYDSKARLGEMDEDHVDAAVFFPTPRLSHSLFANPDPDFHLALVQAYNDWLIEYCSEDTSRLGAIPMLPNRGVGQALREFERIVERPEVKGLLIGCYPHGDTEISSEDDAVWKAIATTGKPLHIHVSLNDTLPTGQAGTKIPGDVRLYDAPRRILQFIWSGVFERFPDLELAIVEVDVGWLPYFKEQIDDRYYRLDLGRSMNLPRPPSYYLEHNFSFTYISDHFGIRNRHAIGVDRIMWSSDYPHSPANWPRSWRTIEAEFSDVPRGERELILAGNAQRLYRFGE
ncbi:MAG TPA: amidohydrolase family protein [Acidimicrobiales bacterium]|jgi:predicted TIM-barrel fold metal-dependent hydrolase|nr:amidohydrolase family protein [Acidimicrobiales bacterium]